MCLKYLLSQLDPSLEAKVNMEKQPVMLEEEYTVRRQLETLEVLGREDERN